MLGLTVAAEVPGPQVPVQHQPFPTGTQQCVISLPAHALAQSVRLWAHSGLEQGLLKVEAVPAGMGERDRTAIWAQALPRYSPAENVSFTKSCESG